MTGFILWYYRKCKHTPVVSEKSIYTKFQIGDVALPALSFGRNIILLLM